MAPFARAGSQERKREGEEELEREIETEIERQRQRQAFEAHTKIKWIKISPWWFIERIIYLQVAIYFVLGQPVSIECYKGKIATSDFSSKYSKDFNSHD